MTFPSGGAGTTYTYNALDQLTAEDGTYDYTYSYDGNGNLTKKEWEGGQTNYVYDWRNKLRKVYNGAVSGLPDLEYAYDHAGNRFAKAERTGSNDFSRVTFLIDNNNLTGYSQTLLEINPNTGAIDKRYEYGDDLYCQVTSPETPDPSAHFFLYDGLGCHACFAGACHPAILKIRPFCKSCFRQKRFRTWEARLLMHRRSQVQLGNESRNLPTVVE